MPASSHPLDAPVLRVADLESARRFHVHALGCTPVRSADGRLELEFCGQPMTLVAADAADVASEAVGEPVATAAFLLGVDDWCTASERLREHGIDFEVEPGKRFSAVPGEQCAMRVSDPDGNVIELRGFSEEAGLLAA